MDHPYKSLPPRAFWRSGVAQVGPFGLRDLWKSRSPLPSDCRFATYGSCFAQHLSRALVGRRFDWVNAEPAPNRTLPGVALQYNYGVFSARTGNIYTAAQLLTWARLATGAQSIESVELWQSPQGRWTDALRPAIETHGFASMEEARRSLATAVSAFRRSVAQADLFIFTMGLTEGWENTETGQIYAMCPGTKGGQFDPALHRFHSYTYPQITQALDEALDLLKAINPNLRFLLTVSPVPLVATASGDHVLNATTYSKSVLRAVAGDTVNRRGDTDYFPSYEIIAAPPSRGMFFEPDGRGIVQQGVTYVMNLFFGGLDLSAPALHADDHAKADADTREAEAEAQAQADELVCEEIILEQFNGA